MGNFIVVETVIGQLFSTLARNKFISQVRKQELISMSRGNLEKKLDLARSVGASIAVLDKPGKGLSAATRLSVVLVDYNEASENEGCKSIW